MLDNKKMFREVNTCFTSNNMFLVDITINITNTNRFITVGKNFGARQRLSHFYMISKLANFSVLSVSLIE